MSKFFKESLELHRLLRGKWAIKSKVPLQNSDDLSLAYTPGVAAVSSHIAENPASSYALTMKGNSVAIVSDGSSVLGLGDIGPEAALPVMEGKAILFKEFADIDGVPLVIDADSVGEIVSTVKAIAPTFGGINLEDIAAPKCFQIEKDLQGIGIPVFHDDQHGTAIVLLAALINACKVTKKPIETLKVVINGAGAAGTAIAGLLRCVGQDSSVCMPVDDVLVCDSKGIISKDRDNLNPEKTKLLAYSNRHNRNGSLLDALKEADVFIGVSKGNLLCGDDIKLMNSNPVILAMANPIPEIMPDEALQAGASVVGTGRSDFPNQVNNVLAFPGIFRGALDARATHISEGMKIAAAHALADCVNPIDASHVLPNALNRDVARKVAEAVKAQAIAEGLQRAT